jgi:hypothetical protein
MTLNCPSCGQPSEFRMLTRLDYDSETGPSSQDYAVCEQCHSVIDAFDLDRQHETELKDAKRVLCRIEPTETQNGKLTRIEFFCSQPPMEGMTWIPATLYVRDGRVEIMVRQWNLNVEQCLAMTIAMRMALVSATSLSYQAAEQALKPTEQF